MNLSLALMVRNEECSILDTMESCVGVVSSIYVYDTGSTDNTLGLVRKFEKEHADINIHVIEGEFVDFSTSRNFLLNVMDENKDIDYILMLDSNDILKGGDKIINCIENTKETAFLVRQEWYYGNKKDVYFNVRLIKAREGWRYKGVVHEYICQSDGPNDRGKITNNDIVIYQDRTINSGSSADRHVRDYEMLLKEYERDNTDTRTTYYLAQTCLALNKIDEAYKYYSARSELIGFYEEVFSSQMACGDLAIKMGLDEMTIVDWYFKAIKKLPNRAEPYTKLANYYLFQAKNHPQHALAHTFIKSAVRFQYPSDAILWVDNDIYEYKRYHIAGIACYYMGDYEDGYKYCNIAYDKRKLDIDKNNKSFYDDKISL